MILSLGSPGLLLCPADPFSSLDLLRAFDLDCFERDESVIYGLDSELRLIYCNPAWGRFAKANGASRLEPVHVGGLSLMGVIPAPLREFYRRSYSGVLVTGTPWQFIYECSSAQLERRFQMTVHATPRRNALIVVNSLVFEAPQTRTEHEAGRLYRNLNGFIIMCAHCRRTKSSDNLARWDWVPEYVERMPEQVSHSLCQVCKELHFGIQFRASRGVSV